MRTWVIAVCLLGTPCVYADQGGNRFGKPIETPAVQSAKASRATLNGLAQSGTAVAAVGRLGIALTSGDGGATWLQATVPLQSDLVAVAFITDKRLLAVGHEGVVLASEDGGRTWQKKFDGASMAVLARSYYQKLLDASPGDPALAAALKQSERLVEEGADKPFLDVWFLDNRRGFIVGAFNLIFATEDGGQTWMPWFDRLDNPNSLHLTAIRSDGEDVYLVGEQGIIFRLDASSRRFLKVTSPHAGSFFSVAVKGPRILVMGLRGRAFLSGNAGASWEALQTRTESGLTSGAFMPDGRIVLASSDGNFMVGKSDGTQFTQYPCGMACHAVLPIREDTLIVTGSRGVRVLRIQQPDKARP